MLSQKARFAIAKFLTGMLNQDDLNDYIEEIRDDVLALFLRRLNANEHILVSQEDGTGRASCFRRVDNSLGRWHSARRFIQFSDG